MKIPIRINNVLFNIVSTPLKLKTIHFTFIITHHITLLKMRGQKVDTVSTFFNSLKYYSYLTSSFCSSFLYVKSIPIAPRGAVIIIENTARAKINSP